MKVTFDEDTCTIFTVSRSHQAKRYTYLIIGPLLEPVQHYKYLEVELSEDLKWNIQVTTALSERLTDLLDFNYSCPKRLRKILFISKTYLGYASRVWDPHAQKQINHIESLQRRAARIVKLCDGWTPGSVTLYLNELRWPFKEQRGKKSRLSIMYTVDSTPVSWIW